MRKEREEFKTMGIVCGQLRQLQPDAAAKRQAMAQMEGLIRRKRIRYTPSWRELALIELQYISRSFWVMQAGVVTILLIWLGRTSALQGALKDYLQWISVAAAWMGVIACGDLETFFQMNGGAGTELLFQSASDVDHSDDFGRHSGYSGFASVRV